jgi:hypothetical protein
MELVNWQEGRSVISQDRYLVEENLMKMLSTHCRETG